MTASRNLWPLSIMIALGLFILGTVGLIILASSNRTELVQRNYYEEELKYQRQLERIDRTQRLNPPVGVAYDAVRQHITLAFPAQHAHSHVEGLIHLYRPSAAGLDRKLKLELSPEGIQILDVKDLLPGLWKVKISWTVERLEYFIDQSVVIGTKVSWSPQTIRQCLWNT